MTNSYDDSARLVPILADLRDQKQIPTRVYRAFLHAPDRGCVSPDTIGDLRYALKEPGTPRLRRIPHIGTESIAMLHVLFVEHAQR
jgi:hypothetical protein